MWRLLEILHAKLIINNHYKKRFDKSPKSVYLTTLIKKTDMQFSQCAGTYRKGLNEVVLNVIRSTNLVEFNCLWCTIQYPSLKTEITNGSEEEFFKILKTFVIS